MANFLASMAWGSLKPILRDWLTKRALVLPIAIKSMLAKKYNVPIEAVTAINDELIAQAAAQLDQFKP